MNIKIRKFLLIAAACAAAAALSSCGGSQSATTAASESASDGTAAADETLTEPENLGTVTLGEYKGVDLEVGEVNVTDENVDTYIQSLLAANPDETEVDRAAQSGDIVNIDYVGKMDGVAFEGGSATGYDLELGSGTFIDGFEDGLIGAKKGETRTIDVTFPDPYPSQPDYAGKAATFEVTVNSVKEKKDAVLNDDWVNRVTNGQTTTVDDFKAWVKDQLTKQMEQTEKNLEMSSILQTVMDNSEFQVSDEAISYYSEVERRQFESTLSQYGMSLDSYLTTMSLSQEEYDKQIEESATQDAERRLVVEAIAKAENLETLTDADYNAVEQMYGYSKDMLVSMAGQDAVDADALSLKVLNFLIDNANKIPRSTETASAASESSEAASDAGESASGAGSEAASESGSEATESSEAASESGSDAAESSEAASETESGAAESSEAESASK